MRSAVCPYCGKDIVLDEESPESLATCPWCGADLPPPDEFDAEAARISTQPKAPAYSGLEAASALLKLLGAAVVVFGVVVAPLAEQGPLVVLGGAAAGFQLLVLALLIDALRDIAINTSVIRQIAELDRDDR